MKVEHRQGQIRETRCSNAAGFLLFGVKYFHVASPLRASLRSLPRTAKRCFGFSSPKLRSETKQPKGRPRSMIVWITHVTLYLKNENIPLRSEPGPNRETRCSNATGFLLFGVKYFHVVSPLRGSLRSLPRTAKRCFGFSSPKLRSETKQPKGRPGQ